MRGLRPVAVLRLENDMFGTGVEVRVSAVAMALRCCESHALHIVDRYCGRKRKSTGEPCGVEGGGELVEGNSPTGGSICYCEGLGDITDLFLCVYNER